VPIITFLNKLDRESRDPVRPLGRDRADPRARRDPGLLADRHGARFLGTYDLFADALLLFENGVHDRVTEPIRGNGLDDPQLPRLLPKQARAKLREEVEIANGLCPPFDPEACRASHLTPVYFGSALKNFAWRLETD